MKHLYTSYFAVFWRAVFYVTLTYLTCNNQLKSNPDNNDADDITTIRYLHRYPSILDKISESEAGGISLPSACLVKMNSRVRLPVATPEISYFSVIPLSLLRPLFLLFPDERRNLAKHQSFLNPGRKPLSPSPSNLCCSCFTATLTATFIIYRHHIAIMTAFLFLLDRPISSPPSSSFLVQLLIILGPLAVIQMPMRWSDYERCSSWQYDTVWSAQIRARSFQDRCNRASYTLLTRSTYLCNTVQDRWIFALYCKESRMDCPKVSSWNDTIFTHVSLGRLENCAGEHRRLSYRGSSLRYWLLVSINHKLFVYITGKKYEPAYLVLWQIKQVRVFEITGTPKVNGRLECAYIITTSYSWFSYLSLYSVLSPEVAAVLPVGRYWRPISSSSTLLLSRIIRLMMTLTMFMSNSARIEYRCLKTSSYGPRVQDSGLA